MENISIQFKSGEEIQVPFGTTLYQLAARYQSSYQTPIVAAKYCNGLKELYTPLEQPVKGLEFIDLMQKDGMRIYQRTATFLLIAAAKKVFPHTTLLVNHHITGGYFCEFSDTSLCNAENIARIAQEMTKMVAAKSPIHKKAMPVEEALEMFKQENMQDKKELMKYRRTSFINIYELEGVKDYFYGYMVPNAAAITLFELIPYAHGFILLFPNEARPTELSSFIPQPKLSEVFRESENWARILDVDIVASLNNSISKGKIEELIYVSEALHEKKIAQIADQIMMHRKTKLVLIAGPSSSGKTTFAKRLCIQLKVNGLIPHLISIDDYFVDRQFTPRDETGAYDFEAFEAIDVTSFNDHIKRLIRGETVEIPSFNFKTGLREYRGNKITLGEEDILVVEGIHGLNEKLSYAIPKENKYKVYISCLTQLNIDYHNRIPTTDTRLIRRMIRDNAYRGFDAERTLEIWPSVRRGENKNIFPYQEEADSMFNSVLIYELAILKQKVEPLLFNIPRESPYYGEAKRLLKFLEYFLPVDTAHIPGNSILREFIGGSCFK